MAASLDTLPSLDPDPSCVPLLEPGPNNCYAASKTMVNKLQTCKYTCDKADKQCNLVFLMRLQVAYCQFCGQNPHFYLILHIRKALFFMLIKRANYFLILRMHLCRQGWEDVYGYLYCCHTYLYFIVYLLLMSSL